MTKYHIAKSGAPAPCTASVKECPLGEATPHGDFDVPEQAQAWAEQVLSKSYGGSFGAPTGTRLANNGDDTYTFPAGRYRIYSTDGWEPFDDEEVEDESLAAELDTWSTAAWESYLPGGISVVSFRGRPMAFMPAEDIGDNHGYDGEILVPEEFAEEFEAAGYFDNTDFYPAEVVELDSPTSLGGRFGDQVSILTEDDYLEEFPPSSVFSRVKRED